MCIDEVITMVTVRSVIVQEYHIVQYYVTSSIVKILSHAQKVLFHILHIGQIHANVNQKICRLEIVFDRLWYPPVYHTTRRHRSEAHRFTPRPPGR